MINKFFIVVRVPVCAFNLMGTSPGAVKFREVPLTALVSVLGEMEDVGDVGAAIIDTKHFITLSSAQLYLMGIREENISRFTSVS